MRALAFAAALLLGVSARADVRYAFKSAFASFALVASSPLTKGIVVRETKLVGPKGFLGAKVVSVEFRPGWAGSDALVVRQDDRRAYTFVFPKGTFGRYGSAQTRVGIRGALTMTRGARR